MSIVLIRQALETALDALDPPLPTAWENGDLDDGEGGAQVPAGPYQSVWLLLANPVNSENSASHMEHGFLQVNLRYPTGDGTADAGGRAELIRAHFRRGTTFTRGGIAVTVDGTPAVAQAMQDNKRYVVPIRIPFFSHVRL